MKVTLKDVALKADVSITSVSQVLNGRDIRITEEKRKLIKDVAKELKYSANPYHDEDIEISDKTIGLIIPDISNLYFSEMSKGIIQEAKRSKIDVIIADSDNDFKNDLASIENLRRKGVKGIIIAFSDDKVSSLNHIINKVKVRDGIPIVLLDRSNTEFDCHSVMVNHYFGGYLATQHLAALGHKRIGCITGPLEVETARQRFLGYKRACEEAGLKIDDKIIAYGDYQIESGYENCKQLIQNNATAIFACNDMMAYGAFNYLREVDIKVPDQVSLVGFDDVFFSRIMEVPLTTISQPIAAIGKRAVHMLMDTLDFGENEKKSSVFDVQLVIRKTTKEYLGN